MFGVNCSPFLLGATIEYHLEKYLKDCLNPKSLYTSEIVQKLSDSFYVDNYVTSVPDVNMLNTFVRESTQIMAEGQFDLRGWEFSRNSREDDFHAPLLGSKIV